MKALMKALMNPFWNRSQRRLRALWRLALQGVLLVVSMVPLGILGGLLWSAWVLTHPGGAGSVDRASLAAQPAFQLLNGVVALAAMLFSTWAAGRFLDRRPFAGLGFHFSRAWWRDLGFGLALGAVLMGGIFLAESAAGWVTVTGTLQAGGAGQAFAPAVVTALLFFVCVGIYEELLSRGYQLHNLAEGLNLRALGPRAAILLAWVLSSSVFGLLHARNPNASVASTASLVLAGLFLGLGFVLTGELAISIGLHISWNLFEGNVFGFAVSGASFGPTFIAIRQVGPELWTGGAFGPEAGLMGIGAILVGSGLILLWVRRCYGQAGLCSALAESPRRLAAEPAEGLLPPEGPGAGR